MFWSNFLNPRSTYIKKYLYEILKNKYAQNEGIIDRITSQLSLEGDSQDFIRLIGDIFESGYIIAVDQHKEALSKIGMKVTITNDNKSVGIFDQSEKSG